MILIVLENDCISIKFGPTSQGLDIEKTSNGCCPRGDFYHMMCYQSGNYFQF